MTDIKVICDSKLEYSIWRDGWTKENKLSFTTDKTNLTLEGITDEELKKLGEVIELHLSGLKRKKK